MPITKNKHVFKDALGTKVSVGDYILVALNGPWEEDQPPLIGYRPRNPRL